MKKMKFIKRGLGVAAALAMAGGLALSPAAAQEKYKIFPRRSNLPKLKSSITLGI